MPSASGHRPNDGSRKDTFPAAVPDMLEALRALKVANPKATRSTVHVYPGSLYAPGGSAPDRRLTSWKMTEHMYFRGDNNFPTLARGLFTEEVNGVQDIPTSAVASYGNGEVKERIVARGYDKFFNTDEMAWTSWDAIAKHSQAPYHLTLKSNGCLIMISALSPEHLLVASKHSLGTTTEAVVTHDKNVDEVADKLKDVDLNQNESTAKEDEEDLSSMAHAEVGRLWVKRTLDQSGRSQEELAKRLWNENLTAVLELCDDSFEEHVIATPDYWTGLHLHGLNYNTPHFATKSPEDVTAFAKEFGFIVTKHLTLNSAEEVKKFADEVAQTGSWEGDMIEGFVVRSTVRDTPDHAETRPPYRPGAPFFFKIKFEEPYLLYRQFRETTRALLPLLNKKTKPEAQAEVQKKARTRARRPEVAVYVEWCVDMMAKEPGLFANYDRGVVRVRDRFLEWVEGDGKATWEAAKAGKWKPGAALHAEKAKAEKEAAKASLPKKWVLVPVAVPGCGKTTVGVALSKIFGFGHTQSDDVLAKKTAPTFKKNIVELLKTKDVVYADRNNHIDKHYTELAGLSDERQFDKVLKPFNVRYIGIIWDIDAQPYHRLLRLCSERVVTRGDNHQTLRPDATVDAEHEAVVAQFLHNYTTPDPTMFDEIISVSVEDDPRAALEKVVDGLVKALSLPQPSGEDVDRALAEAMGYETKTPFHGGARVGKTVRYFGLAPEIDLEAVADEALASPMSSAATESAKALLAKIRAAGRVTKQPHITLSHNKNVAAEQETAGEGAPPGPQARAWETCKALAESRISPMYDFDMTHLAWDGRVMALVVANLRPKRENGREVGPELELPAEVRENLHITIGTREEDISAFESRSVVRAAREGIAAGHESGDAGEAVGGGGEVHWVPLSITGVGRVRGMY